jgi:hypothetical protein
MEEINKSRLAASKAFKEFQNNFFERKELVEDPNVDSPYPEVSTMTPKRRSSFESMQSSTLKTIPTNSTRKYDSNDKHTNNTSGSHKRSISNSENS